MGQETIPVLQLQIMNGSMHWASMPANITKITKDHVLFDTRIQPPNKVDLSKNTACHLIKSPDPMFNFLEKQKTKEQDRLTRCDQQNAEEEKLYGTKQRRLFNLKKLQRKKKWKMTNYRKTK